MHSSDLFNCALAFFCRDPADNRINCFPYKPPNRRTTPLCLRNESPPLLWRDQDLEPFCEHAHMIHSSPVRAATTADSHGAG